MKRGAVLAVGLMLATVAGRPNSLDAQQPQGTTGDHAEARALLIHQLDSLMPLAREARRRAEVMKAQRTKAELAARTEPTDTLQVGLLTVITPAGRADLARDIVGEAWRVYAPMLASLDHLEEPVLAFQWATPLRSIVTQGTTHRVELPRWRSRAYVVSSVRQAIGAKLFTELDGHPLRGWSPTEVRAPWDVGRVYRRMAVKPAGSVRACLAGSLDNCRRALALDVTKDPWSWWYTPEERRRLARETRGGTVAQAHAREECIEQDSQAACDAYLKARYPAVTGAPAPVKARASLLWMALEKGGSDSFVRLAADRGQSPAEALESASGEDLDRLLAEWREWFQAHRPDVPAQTSHSRWIALTWILLFGALAMRSTRWRSG